MWRSGRRNSAGNERLDRLVRRGERRSTYYYLATRRDCAAVSIIETAIGSRNCSPHEAHTSISTPPTTWPLANGKDEVRRTTRREPHIGQVLIGVIGFAIRGAFRRDEEVVDFLAGFARDAALRIDERTFVGEPFDDIESVRAAGPRLASGLQLLLNSGALMIASIASDRSSPSASSSVAAFSVKRYYPRSSSRLIRCRMSIRSLSEETASLYSPA